jgi:hypothetical protein
MTLILAFLKVCGLGILYAIPSLIYGRWLGATGKAREKPLWAIGMSILTQLMAHRILSLSALAPWQVGGVILLSVMSPMSIYYIDLRLSRQYGKWWWLESGYQGNKNSPLVLLYAGIVLIVSVIAIIWVILAPPVH